MSDDSFDVNKLVKVYLKMRDQRTVLKREFEEKDVAIKLKMEKIENALLAFLEQAKIDKMGTPLGTVYRSIDYKPSCADWGAFFGWVKEHDAWDFLERRVKKTEIAKLVKAKEDLPPGISVHSSYEVTVRRSS